jgi:hypothetical protein
MKNQEWSHISDPVNALGARILDVLDFLGAWIQPVTLRSLARRMNANKLILWNEALARLVAEECITMVAGPRRQQLIRIIEVPEDLSPRQIVKRPKRKRERGQRSWFKQHLAEFQRRDSNDDGLQEGKSMPENSTGHEHNMSQVARNVVNLCRPPFKTPKLKISLPIHFYILITLSESIGY